MTAAPETTAPLKPGLVDKCGVNRSFQIKERPPAPGAAKVPQRETTDAHHVPNALPGDYVLATKYSDADPGDGWAVGYYIGPINFGGETRYLVGDKEGRSLRANGYRRVGRIEADFGNWLLKGAKYLERSPPGSVNLWNMQTGTTRDAERIDKTAPVGEVGRDKVEDAAYD